MQILRERTREEKSSSGQELENDWPVTVLKTANNQRIQKKRATTKKAKTLRGKKYDFIKITMKKFNYGDIMLFCKNSKQQIKKGDLGKHFPKYSELTKYNDGCSNGCQH